MRIAVCDDDADQRHLVASFIKESNIFDTYTLFEYISAEDLLSAIYAEPYFDVVFLDVEMNGMNGIEAGRKIKEINRNSLIIYVSSHSKYAIESFDNDPLHYILKPINKDKFFEVLRKAKHKSEILYNKISISQKEGVISLYLKNIIYIEHHNRHLVYHCTDGRYEVVGKVKDIADKLEKHGFILINQGILINAEHVKQISKLDIIMDNGEKVMISVRKKTEVLIKYSRYLKDISL